MSDFLLELRSEEIPARMQAGARDELARLFRREMEAAGVSVGDLTVWSTPRRLALIARDLPEESEARREETRGPKLSAPDQAKEGFARSRGRRIVDLEVRDEYLWDVVEHPGLSTHALLADAIPAIVRDFSWPKSMRWGAASLSTESLRWVRPLSGIVAILGEELVECEVDGIKSGRETAGHRFHGIRKSDPKSRNFGLPIEFFKDPNPIVLNANGMIEIGNADEYEQKLLKAHVIVDHKKREDIIRVEAQIAAKGANLTLVEDEGLVIENAGLAEWPVPLLGRFDEAYLDVPPEVIQLTARTNQKYFVCNSADGKLANAFVCTANIEAADGGAAIVDGNRKVLAARLSDARFFWEQDRKTPLADHAKKLERITFHEKLGTVADKVERVAKLARWLVEEGIVKPASVHVEQRSSVAENVVETPLDKASRQARTQLEANGVGRGQLADLAEQAARLAKADLVTEMVGEFPELQGLMGGYYARAEGLPDEVADAIRDHYKPVGQGDEVPTAPVTVAVSLADKLDTLVSFFAVNLQPTGSKDPFALRRSAIGSTALAIGELQRFPVKKLTKQVLHTWFDRILYEPHPITLTLSGWDLRDCDPEAITSGAYENDLWEGVNDCADCVLDFFADRLKVQQREAGVRHDLIDAVFALGGEDDLVRLLARVHALQAFMATEDGANLLAGYKRAANILKKEDWHGIEGEISRTGEEDPLAMVDDPDMKAVIDAKMTERHAKTLSYTPEPAEKALIDALDAAEPRAAAAIAAENFAAAMSALASLRAPIDRFFEDVIVNADEEAKRTARLALLARFRDAVHRVADFSRIEGGG